MQHTAGLSICRVHVLLSTKFARNPCAGERSPALTHRLHDRVSNHILKMFWKNDTSQLPAP